MDIVKSGAGGGGQGPIHKPGRQQHKEILPQRRLRKQPVACFFFS